MTLDYIRKLYLKFVAFATVKCTLPQFWNVFSFCICLLYLCSHCLPWAMAAAGDAESAGTDLCNFRDLHSWSMCRRCRSAQDLMPGPVCRLPARRSFDLWPMLGFAFGFILINCNQRLTKSYPYLLHVLSWSKLLCSHYSIVIK